MARRASVPVVLALLAVLVAAGPALAQQPKRGGVLRVAEREAPGLDPHLSISFLTHSYVSLTYSQLVRFPNGPEQKSPTDFSILPDLAEKWMVSKDGKVYTFTLRKGVRFHNKPPVNGREATAEDVKYSLERFMAKSGFRDRFEPVTAIDAVDRYTVRITLKEPYAPFLNHLANPSFCAILPREAEEKFKDFNHPDAVIGTGPFVLKSYEKGVKMVFERNPAYFMKGLPYLDGAVIEITPDAAARLSVLRAGKAELPHVWGWISPEEARSLKQTSPEMSVTPYQVIGQGFIYMRTDRAPFNDVKVRRAIALAIVSRSRDPGTRPPVFVIGSANATPVSGGGRSSTAAARSNTWAWAASLSPAPFRWTIAVSVMSGAANSSALRRCASSAGASAGMRPLSGDPLCRAPAGTATLPRRHRPTRVR